MSARPSRAKAVREKTPDETVPFAHRASAALRDERADYWRRRNARPNIDLDATVEESAGEASGERRVEFADLVARLRCALGDEAVAYALLVCAGYSEREIAERPGWDRLRAGRVRKRLERQAPVILADLIDHTRHKEAS